jgi:hypothetical protein
MKFSYLEILVKFEAFVKYFKKKILRFPLLFDGDIRGCFLPCLKLRTS